MVEWNAEKFLKKIYRASIGIERDEIMFNVDEGEEDDYGEGEGGEGEGGEGEGEEGEEGDGSSQEQQYYTLMNKFGNIIYLTEELKEYLEAMTTAVPEEITEITEPEPLYYDIGPTDEYGIMDPVVLYGSNEMSLDNFLENLGVEMQHNVAHGLAQRQLDL